MSEVEEEIFEETATKEPEPKRKKPKKKRVISEAQRKQMLENLRKGRETSKRNRQARGQAKKLIKEKVKRNIDAVLSGKDLVEKDEKEEKVPIEKVATFAKEEIKKLPKYIAKDLTAQEILLQRIEELKQENLTLREKRKIKKEIAKVEKVIEKEEKKKEVVVVKEEVVNEFTPRRACGQSAPIPIVSNRPIKNVSTFRRPRW
tara:strand:- start:1259 stop:1867 length:609 start_codon:yes stop_codon:yes gene_type:complete